MRTSRSTWTRLISLCTLMALAPPLAACGGAADNPMAPGAGAGAPTPASGPAPLAAMAGQVVTVGVRAENVQTLTTAQNGAVPAKVLVIEPLGSHLLLTMQVGDQSLKVTTPSDFPAAVDHPLWLQPDYGKMRWLDAESGAALRLS